MAIPIKSDAEMAGMRESARLAAIVLQRVEAAVAPGVTTAELDDVACAVLRELHAESAFLHYHGYPAAICVSVNEEVIHGIPGTRRIEIGDVVSLDVGVRYQGFYGDNATTVMVGVTDPSTIELVETTRLALANGIAAVKPGARLGEVSHAIEMTAKAAGCGVVRKYVGHGIGRALHEEPQVPNFGHPNQGPQLKAGMVFCIEPMFTRGTAEVRELSDGWTVVSRDGKPAAHCEHMVAVLPDGVAILTAR